MTLQAHEYFACPHCGSTHQDGGLFCGACGKAVPSTAGTPPRIIEGNETPTTAAGQTLHGMELHAATFSASSALLLVAVVQTLSAMLILYIGMSIFRRRLMFYSPVSIASTLAFPGLFWGLYIWGRRTPFPAAITGLVLYSGLTLLDLAIASGALWIPRWRKCHFTIGGIWVRGMVIVALVRAVRAGMRYRKFQRESGAPW